MNKEDKESLKEVLMVVSGAAILASVIVTYSTALMLFGLYLKKIWGL